MLSYDFVLLALVSHPCLGRMGCVVGLRVGCLRFLVYVVFLDGLEVSLFCELFVHCRLGDFLMGCTSAEVFGSMFSGFGFLL